LQERGFTEKDWKLFRNKIADWQESYMDRLGAWDKRIKEDKKKTGVQLEMRQSNLIYNIIALINEGAISYVDLEEFSDELKETVRFFVER